MGRGVGGGMKPAGEAIRRGAWGTGRGMRPVGGSRGGGWVGGGMGAGGKADPPVGLSNVTAIAAGWGTSLALRRDGTVEEWGWDGGYGLKATAESLSNI